MRYSTEHKITAIAAAAAIASSIIPSVSAYEADDTQNIFLCMLNGYNSVIKGEKNGDNMEAWIDKINVLSDSGETLELSPYIKDGSTYLPFRYCAEQMGLVDLNRAGYSTPSAAPTADPTVAPSEAPLEKPTETPMWEPTPTPTREPTEAPEETPAGFRFIQTENGSLLVISAGDEEQTYVIDKDFTISAGGIERDVRIENVNGSLYVPIRLLEQALDISVKYDSRTGCIYLARNEGIMKSFVDYKAYNGREEYTLKDRFENLYTYNAYNNPMNYSDIYIDSNGKIHSLNEQLEGSGQSYRSVTRIMDTLYATGADGNVYSMPEITDDTYMTKYSGYYPVTAVTAQMNIDYAIAQGTKIIGVNANEEGGYIGKIFRYDIATKDYFSNVGSSGESPEQFAPIFITIGDGGYSKDYICYLDNPFNTSIMKYDLEYNTADVLLSADKIGNKGINYFAMSEEILAYVDNDNMLYIVPISVNYGDIEVSGDIIETKFPDNKKIKNIQVCGSEVFILKETDNNKKTCIYIDCSKTNRYMKIENGNYNRLSLFDIFGERSVFVLEDGEVRYVSVL